MKAYIWALYLPQYADLLVEVKIGDRYKPDVVMLDPSSSPIFWGEAGEVGQRKIRKLVRRYRHTHFAMAKASNNLDPYVDMVRKELKGVNRSAPFDLLGMGDVSAEPFITPKGHININFDDINFVRIDA